MGGQIDYVYFAYVSPYVKIGRTNLAVEERINQLQTGCPYEITIKCFIKIWRSGFYMASNNVERYIHKICIDGHHRGEWFLGEVVENVVFDSFDLIKSKVLGEMNNVYDIELLSDLEQGRAVYWKYNQKLKRRVEMGITGGGYL